MGEGVALRRFGAQRVEADEFFASLFCFWPAQSALQLIFAALMASELALFRDLDRGSCRIVEMSLAGPA